MLKPHTLRFPRVSPLLVMGIGVLAVSTGSIFIRYAQVYAPSLVIAAYRMVLASIALTPFALHSHSQEIKSLHKGEVGLALLAGLFLALHFTTWITSLEYTSVASSVVFVDSTPIWVGLISPLILRENLSRLSVAGILIAFIGGAVVGVSDSCHIVHAQLICPDLASFVRGKAFWGDLLALMGAWAGAGYLIIGRRLRANLSLMTYTFLVYSTAAILLVIFVLFTSQAFIGYAPQVYLWFILLAFVPQLLGHSSFNYALGYLPASYVAVVLLGEPIGSTVLAYFLLDETPTSFKLLGAGFILIGIYLCSREVK